MKNYLLLAIATLISFSGFAQRSPAVSLTHTNTIVATHAANTAAKTTGIGSTDTLRNITANDTLALYYAGATSDSGYVNGTNAYGDMGFAERYDINGSDSSVQVIGIIATFGGVVNDTVIDTANLKVWSVGPQTEDSDFLGSNYYNSGFPNNVLSITQVPFMQLGIPDTMKAFMFPSIDTVLPSSSFFVGYDMSYSYFNLAGDTIGLFTSINGERTLPVYNTVGTDTVVNNVNVTEYIDGSWHDNATDVYQFNNDLAIFPIVIIGNGNPTGVKSITKNGLAFYGCYPNPAVNSTNIKFSLLQTADVTVQITDISGRVINTIKQPALSTGAHIIPVPTSGLAAGNYLYLVHTSNGDGIASKFTVMP